MQLLDHFYSTHTYNQLQQIHLFLVSFLFFNTIWLLGSEARQALSQLALRLAVQTNSEKSQMLGSLYGHLTWSGQMPGPSLTGHTAPP